MGNNASKYWLDASLKEEELILNEELKFQNALGRYLWRSCTKHAGHQNFIPAKEFKESHLPPRFQNNKVLSWILAVSDLTVRIIVRFTSEQRPPDDKLYKRKGMDCIRFGSGMVTDVVILKNDSICTCPECMKGSEKPSFTASIHVSTACHVVFDATEAVETEAELFYDDDNDLESIKTLHGSEELQCSEGGDTCVFKCITHDKVLADTLIEKLNSLQGMEEKLGKMSLHSPGSLSVVASHPHGAPKHISIGEIEQLHATSLTMESRMTHDLVKIDRDKAIFLLTLGEPCIQIKHDMVNKNDETEATGILVEVSFPDGIKTTLNIWQLGEPVHRTKKWLLDQEGFHNVHTRYTLVIDRSEGDSVEMDDEKDINHYWDDLTVAVRMWFKERNNFSSSVLSTPTGANLTAEFGNGPEPIATQVAC